MRLILLALILSCVGCGSHYEFEVGGSQSQRWYAQVGSRVVDGTGPGTVEISGRVCIPMARPANPLVTHGYDILPLRARIVERRDWPKPDKEFRWVEVAGDTTGQPVYETICPE